MDTRAYKQDLFDSFYILLMSFFESFWVAFLIEIGINQFFNYKNENLFYFLLIIVLYFNAKINKNVNTINELNKIIKENSDEIESLKNKK